MIYEYKCPKCNTHIMRSVDVEQRDNQYCECGEKLNKLFIPTSNICIPQRFQETGNPAEPLDDAAKRQWYNETAPFRGY